MAEKRAYGSAQSVPHYYQPVQPVQPSQYDPVVEQSGYGIPRTSQSRSVERNESHLGQTLANIAMEIESARRIYESQHQNELEGQGTIAHLENENSALRQQNAELRQAINSLTTSLLPPPIQSDSQLGTYLPQTDSSAFGSARNHLVGAESGSVLQHRNVYGSQYLPEALHNITPPTQSVTTPEPPHDDDEMHVDHDPLPPSPLHVVDGVTIPSVQCRDRSGTPGPSPKMAHPVSPRQQTEVTQAPRVPSSAVPSSPSQ